MVTDATPLGLHRWPLEALSYPKARVTQSPPEVLAHRLAHEGELLTKIAAAGA